MKTPRLGRVQHLIMEVLWECDRATAREITERLNKSQPIAHSTVQTLLRKLEAKRAVGHELHDRTFHFYALVKPESVRTRDTRELIERLFSGSAANLVSYLLKNEEIPSGEMDEIKALITRAASRERTKENKS